MAERLTAADSGDLSNITQATILNFVQEMKKAESDIGAALAECKNARQGRKDLRKRIKGSGIRLDVFDRAYADHTRAEDDREDEEKQYRYLMAALGAPVGAQLDLIMDVAPRGNEIIDRDGFDAGKAGFDASTNPYGAGSESHAIWLNAWTRGQAAKVENEIKPPQDQRRAGRRAAAE